jgi:hypothetical protein
LVVIRIDGELLETLETVGALVLFRRGVRVAATTEGDVVSTIKDGAIVRSGSVGAEDSYGIAGHPVPVKHIIPFGQIWFGHLIRHFVDASIQSIPQYIKLA